MIMLNDYRVKVILKALEDERKLNLTYQLVTNLPDSKRQVQEAVISHYVREDETILEMVYSLIAGYTGIETSEGMGV